MYEVVVQLQTGGFLSARCEKDDVPEKVRWLLNDAPSPILAIQIAPAIEVQFRPPVHLN